MKHLARELIVAPDSKIKLADIDAGAATSAARKLGFARSTGDWQALVRDPEVDVVDITTPPMLHHRMALAAAAVCCGSIQ
jgi:predicted dehydrogenase